MAKVARRFRTVSTSRAMDGGGAGATTVEAEWRGDCGVVDVVDDVGDVVMVGGDSGAGEGEARLNAMARLRLRLRLTDGREGGDGLKRLGQVSDLSGDDE